MTKKILFIEDERTLQRTFKEFFEKEKFILISAFDGESGLEIAKKEKPDLILLDIILPKKDGIEVLREIRKDHELKEIPVLILSNLEEIEKIEEALSLGAKGYLIKSENSLFDVLEKVKQILF